MQNDDKNEKVNFGAGFSPEEIEAKLQGLLGGIGIPAWLDKLGSCPLCNADIAKSNLRCIGWKLNAQHIGNFFVEAMCGECRAGFELHFAKVCPDFVSFLGVAISGAGAVPPVPSHKIPPSSNNLIDIMISDRQKEAVADLSD